MPTGRPAARSFRDLVVWQRPTSWYWPSIGSPNHFPSGRHTGWPTRCAAPPSPFRPTSPKASVKRSQAEKARFLNIAEGWLEECRYYCILAHDLGYGQTESLMDTLEDASRLLNAYARAILASG